MKIIILYCLLFVLGVVTSSDSHAKSIEKPRKVIMFVLDGVRFDSLMDAIAQGQASAVGEVMKKGLFRRGYMEAGNQFGENSYPSISGRGWSNIIKMTNDHGVTENTFKGSRNDRPTLFTQAQRQLESFNAMAAVTWGPVIDKIFRPDDLEGKFNLRSFYHMESDSKSVYNYGGDRAVRNYVLSELDRTRILPDISFIGYNGTDEVGHNGGFGSQNSEYLRAIDLLSSFSGEIIQKVEELFPEYDKLYLFTTDHSGRFTDKTHINPSTRWTRRVWTAAYAPKHHIENLGKSINSVDVSALALRFLDLELPTYYKGQMDKVSFSKRTGPQAVFRSNALMSCLKFF